MIIHVDLETRYTIIAWMQNFLEHFELSCVYRGGATGKMQEEIEDSLVFSDLGIEILLELDVLEFFTLWKR